MVYMEFLFILQSWPYVHYNVCFYMQGLSVNHYVCLRCIKYEFVDCLLFFVEGVLWRAFINVDHCLSLGSVSLDWNTYILMLKQVVVVTTTCLASIWRFKKSL